MNIAIYGGSFDPPHIGHEKIVQTLTNTLDIDKLFIVPTYLNPFKNNSHFTPEQRYSLVEELFKNLSKVEVLDYELKQGEATPSIKTVRYIKQEYKPSKIYLVMGADNIAKLHLWSEFDSLNQLVEFIVISRDGYEAKNDIIQFKSIKLNVDVSSTNIRDTKDIEHIPSKIKQKVQNIWNKELKES